MDLSSQVIMRLEEHLEEHLESIFHYEHLHGL